MTQRKRAPTIEEELEAEYVEQVLDGVRYALSQPEGEWPSDGAVRAQFRCDSSVYGTALRTSLEDELRAKVPVLAIAARVREITSAHGARIGVLGYPATATTTHPSPEEQARRRAHPYAKPSARVERRTNAYWIFVQGLDFQRAEAYEIVEADGARALGDRLPDCGGDSRAPSGAGDGMERLYDFFVRELPRPVGPPRRRRP